MKPASTRVHSCGGLVIRAFAAAAWLATTAAAQTTWSVDDDASCPGFGTATRPFCTIGAALAAASPGDTIEVAAGTYHESLVIDKDELTLRGSGATVTTLVGKTASVPIGPPFDSAIRAFTLEGFRIRTAAPSPAMVPGIVADPADLPGALWTIRGCIVEDLATGILAADSYGGAAILIEDTLITRCGTGIELYGAGIVVRRCTLFDIDAVGIRGIFYSTFEVSDSIIASTGLWAVQRYWNSPTTIERVLIHDTNLSNPPELQAAGPFMQYLAEGFPGGFGVWASFTPIPGPVIAADPLFVDPAAGDVRLVRGSPAIDVADAATTTDPAAPCDLLGFGHPRVDDGDFDGVERADLGAIEFGGLLANGGLEGSLHAGLQLVLTQAGKPGAACGLFTGLPDTPLGLGSKGTFFLDPALLLSLATDVIDASGSTTVLSAILPATTAGLQIHFQAVQKGPGPGDGLHWTNAERLSIVP